MGEDVGAGACHRPFMCAESSGFEEGKELC